MVFLEEVVAQLGNARYSFMPEHEFKELLISNPKEGNRIYVTEILYRAHFAAATALLRCQRWVQGVVAARQLPNLLSFAASYRGLIESAADTLDPFLLAGPTLASAWSVIRAVLDGAMQREFHIFGPIEEALIHFMYARRLTRKERVGTPASHQPKSSAQYIELLERAKVPDVRECYAFLCELTHPAADSVFAYAHGHGSGHLIELWPDADYHRISEFCKSYQGTGGQAIMLNLNSALIMLKILNIFQLKTVYTRSVESINLSAVRAWTDIMGSLRAQGWRD